jgi:hypothetical protein
MVPHRHCPAHCPYLRASGRTQAFGVGRRGYLWHRSMGLEQPLAYCRWPPGIPMGPPGPESVARRSVVANGSIRPPGSSRLPGPGVPWAEGKSRKGVAYFRAVPGTTGRPLTDGGSILSFVAWKNSPTQRPRCCGRNNSLSIVMTAAAILQGTRRTLLYAYRRTLVQPSRRLCRSSKRGRYQSAVCGLRWVGSRRSCSLDSTTWSARTPKCWPVSQAGLAHHRNVGMKQLPKRSGGISLRDHHASL